jgi:hypothetical protein
MPPGARTEARGAFYNISGLATCLLAHMLYLGNRLILGGAQAGRRPAQHRERLTILVQSPWVDPTDLVALRMAPRSQGPQ